MPRISKRKNRNLPQMEQKTCYYRTYIYLRLSEKDGGHGRRESIETQKQICDDFIKQHPELLVTKTFVDNGITGTTFERPEFSQLMEDARNKKVDCIVVKDFSRFGRDALDAVDLIDVIFPTLNIRFISVLDEYDSENPSCVQDRVNNILKHFMNDYYAREVSVKLIQAHKLSRNKGEFWGARPPYGYKRSDESSKLLVPDEEEKKTIQQIFNWYVFDGMSAIEIAKALNRAEIPSPSESYIRKKQDSVGYGSRNLWYGEVVSAIVQNPVYIGAAVYGKSKQMLHQNIPMKMIPRNEWEIMENVREPLVEKAIFEKALQIAKERWETYGEIWSVKEDTMRADHAVFQGKIYCENCDRKMMQRWAKNQKVFSYFCKTAKLSGSRCNLLFVNEKYIKKAVKSAIKYQIDLAVDYKKKYGEEFYRQLEIEMTQNLKAAITKYESYESKLELLFEHYAMGVLSKEEYIQIKTQYMHEQQEAHENTEKTQKRKEVLLDTLRTKLDWIEELLKYQHNMELTKEMVNRLIQKVVVKSSGEFLVCFWFGDIFEDEIDQGGVSYAI